MDGAQRFGKYEVLEELGQGGMSVVYRGRDTVLGREVAIKVLHPFMAQKTDAKQRFYREAMAVAKLSHPNILEIYDYSGETAERAYIVMEYIRGETLASFASRVDMKLPELGFLIIRSLATALVHAHEQGIIHRDLKPENVMIRKDGRLKLMDFGIAQMIDADTLTTTGALLGSPAHMSPELIEGEVCDVRSDIFSVGTILYWLMTRRLPFSAPTAPALFKKIVDGNFDDPRVHNPLVSQSMLRVLQKLMKKRREDRYQTARELLVDLDEELAKASITDPETALRDFLTNPEPFQEALIARTKTRLREQGDQASGRGDWPNALDAYDRLLSLDPSDALLRQRVLTLGRKQHQRRRLRRAVRVLEMGAGAITLFVATAVLGWKLLTGGELAANPADELSASPPPQFAIQRLAPQVVAAPSGGLHGPSGDEAKKPDPVAPQAREQSVEFRLPKWADLYIDGELAERALQGSRAKTLSVGKHKIRAENPFMEPVEREIDIGASPPPPVVIVLDQFRPALLRVVAKPGAQAVIDGEARGATSASDKQPFRVAMTGSGDRDIEVRVVVPGEPDRSQRVKVRAGELKALDFTH